MRIILTLDMDDTRLAAEGVTYEKLEKEFSGLKNDLNEYMPGAATVTLRIEPSEPAPVRDVRGNV